MHGHVQEAAFAEFLSIQLSGAVMSRKQHLHTFYPFNYLALVCPGSSIGTISIHSTIWRWHVQEAAFAQFLSIQLSGAGMSRKQHLHNFYPFNCLALACLGSSICTTSIRSSIWRWYVQEEAFAQFLSIQLSGASMSWRQHFHNFNPFNYLALA